MRTIVVACLVVGGCGIEDGTQFEILAAVLPNTQCEFPPDADLFRSRGFWDPSGSQAYTLGVQIRNNLAAQNSSIADAPGVITTDQNTAAVRGFNTCWFKAGDSTEGFKPVASCDDLPAAQKSFVPSSGFIDPGETSPILIDIPDHAVLSTLYDEATPFKPDKIPPGDDPEFTTRNAAWGGFPFERTTLMGVQVRMKAELQDGSVVHSNWFSYPVDICPTCVRDTNPCADPLTLKPCTAPCGTAVNTVPAPTCFGTSCIPGAMFHPNDNLACTATALQGNVLDLFQTCLPFQRFGDPVCVPITECIAL